MGYLRVVKWLRLRGDKTIHRGFDSAIGEVMVDGTWYMARWLTVDVWVVALYGYIRTDPECCV